MCVVTITVNMITRTINENTTLKYKYRKTSVSNTNPPKTIAVFRPDRVCKKKTEPSQNMKIFNLFSACTNYHST